MWYRVVVENDFNEVTSNIAAVFVADSANITQQPADQTVTAPNPATFTTTVDKLDFFLLQWYYRNGSSSPWTVIAGATSLVYVTGVSSLLNGFEYKLTLRDPATGYSFDTRAAKLVVEGASDLPPIANFWSMAGIPNVHDMSFNAGQTEVPLKVTFNAAVIFQWQAAQSVGGLPGAWEDVPNSPDADTYVALSADAEAGYVFYRCRGRNAQGEGYGPTSPFNNSFRLDPWIP